MYQSILASVHQILTLTSQEESAFLSILQPKSFKKKEHIFKEGDLCRKIYFITSGYARAYYNNGIEEVSTDFFNADSWFSNFHSYLTTSPSILAFQAISDLTLIELDIDDVESIYNQYPRMERIGRVLVERVLVSIVNEKRNEFMLPEDRYQTLLKERPDWIQNIPQKYIASYFKIQPESLSRIKNRIYSINS
jgi:CRP-like cAMP-binding protein